MRWMTLGLIVMSLLLPLAGCESKPTVRATFRPEADFKAYKTYTWSESIIRTTDSWLDKQNLDASIRKLVEARLLAKGYQLVGTSLQEPDFLVQYEADQFNDGSLTLRVIDTKLRRVVWTATIEAVIQQPSEKPEERTAALDKATTELLAEFPPPQHVGPLPEPVTLEPRVQSGEKKPDTPAKPDAEQPTDPATPTKPDDPAQPKEPSADAPKTGDAQPAEPNVDEPKPDDAKPKANE